MNGASAKSSPLSSAPPLINPHAGQVGAPFIIELPHEGFNPSILCWEGKLLLAWRRDWACARLWLGELDEAYRLQWSREVNTGSNLQGEDALEYPRLVVAGGRLHLVCSVLTQDRVRMGLLRLGPDAALEEAHVFDNVHGRWEKNWQFFEHEGALHAVYAVNPHTVGPLSGGELRVPPAHEALHPWAWGERRGGTPPVRMGD